MTKDLIKRTLLRLVTERGSNSSCCPSDVARALVSDDWRSLMPQIREIADELQAEQQIEILQRDKRIDSAVNAVGPIRLRLSHHQ